MRTTNIITWGNGHKRFIKDKDKARLAAKEKAFYFDNVYLNGEKVSINL